MRVILALVGMTGSGKSECANYIATKYDFQKVYFGGVVLAQMAAEGLSVSPEHERLVNERLRQQRGMAAIAMLAASEIDTYLSSDKNVVIDGLYSTEEWEYLRLRYRNVLSLLAVHAHRQIRYQRLSIRNLRPLSNVEAEARDNQEVLRLGKAPPIALADFHIVNNTSLSETTAAIDSVMRDIQRGVVISSLGVEN